MSLSLAFCIAALSFVVPSTSVTTIGPSSSESSDSDASSSSGTGDSGVGSTTRRDFLDFFRGRSRLAGVVPWVTLFGAAVFRESSLGSFRRTTRVGSSFATDRRVVAVPGSANPWGWLLGFSVSFDSWVSTLSRFNLW